MVLTGHAEDTFTLHSGYGRRSTDCLAGASASTLLRFARELTHYAGDVSPQDADAPARSLPRHAIASRNGGAARGTGCHLRDQWERIRELTEARANARSRLSVFLSSSRRPVGDDDRHLHLHRLQRVRRRLPGREQHPRRRARRSVARAARCTGSASTPTIAGRPTAPDGAPPADALPALRERAVRVRVPGQRHGAQPRRPQRDGLQPLRRHAVLLEQLPVQGPALQLVRLERAASRPTRAASAAAQPRRHRARSAA